jgi:hypothetical protein
MAQTSEIENKDLVIFAVVIFVLFFFLGVQDGFESVMAFSLPWQKWKVPICIAYQGLFIHEEIETST